MNRIEKKAWDGWKEFHDVMNEIWIKYQASEEEAINKDLKRVNKKIKNLFIEAENDSDKFLSIIRKFWEKNYHFVVDNYEQLASAFINVNKINGIIYISLLPEVDDCKWGVFIGKNNTISLTERFYYELINKLERQGCIKVLSVKEERVFEIVKTHNTDNNLYKVIGVLEIQPIKV